MLIYSFCHSWCNVYYWLFLYLCCLYGSEIYLKLKSKKLSGPDAPVKDLCFNSKIFLTIFILRSVWVLLVCFWAAMFWCVLTWFFFTLVYHHLTPTFDNNSKWQLKNKINLNQTLLKLGSIIEMLRISLNRSKCKMCRLFLT